jgi:hypothetical protein
VDRLGAASSKTPASARLRPLLKRRLVSRAVRRRVAGTKLRERVTGRLTAAFGLSIEPSEQLPSFESLGLPIAEIEGACGRYNIDGLVRRIHGRGATAAHLHRIAWHGSALADIGCAPDHPARKRLLLDGALFNLAVALTDSLADDDPRAGALAARVLDPERLARRLSAPQDPQAAIDSPGSDLAVLYRLWDALLVHLGDRFAGDRNSVEHLAAMLAQMHHSEFEPNADRLTAKVMPVEFIGALLRDPAADSPSVLEALYRELGRLFALADDWYDLAADMRHLRANQFIQIRDRTPANRARYLARCMQRLVLPGRLADEASVELSALVTGALGQARAVSPRAHAHGAAYVKGVLSC